MKNKKLNNFETRNMSRYIINTSNDNIEILMEIESINLLKLISYNKPVKWRLNNDTIISSYQIIKTFSEYVLNYKYNNDSYLFGNKYNIQKDYFKPYFDISLTHHDILKLSKDIWDNIEHNKNINFKNILEFLKYVISSLER